MLKIVLYFLFSSQVFAQQSVIHSDSSINPGQVFKFIDGEVTCYLATKKQFSGGLVGATMSCTGDTSKVSSNTSFMGGEVTRLKDGGTYCYYFSVLRASAIGCVK